jgi:hypothetical protein
MAGTLRVWALNVHIIHVYIVYLPNTSNLRPPLTCNPILIIHDSVKIIFRYSMQANLLLIITISDKLSWGLSNS